MFCSFCSSAVWIGLVLGFIALARKFLFKTKLVSLKNRHVLVTGGSLGIGKCFAIEAAKQGAAVTIMARTVESLENAVVEIKRQAIDPNQKIQYLSCDLSNNFDELERSIEELEQSVGPVFMLVNCAGTSICAKLEDLADKDIKYLMNLNILGTILPCKVMVPRMKARKEGHIIITASQAALVGIFGYSVYSATKFALRGFAEALHMEVKPHDMKVTLALPPDTDTPGFAEEQKNKPLETRMISESAGIVQPEVVASQMMTDSLQGKFVSTVGFESAVVSTLCAGMAPISTYSQLAVQVLTTGILRVVGVLVLHQFNGIVKKCQRDRDNNKKAE